MVVRSYKMPSHFPCSPVIRGCLWKKTQVEKKVNQLPNYIEIIFVKLNLMKESAYFIATFTI